MSDELSKIEARKRIEKLSEVIDEKRYEYQVLDSPSISDAEYDSLMRELVALEQKYPDLKLKSSPSQKVGGDPLKKFETVAHRTQMFSLNDAFNEKEVKDWYARISRLVDPKNIDRSGYYCEIKMDGLAIELIYKNGELIQALTRGNGLVGENVTNNIRTIKNIPLKLRSKSKIYNQVKDKTIEIRGEIYMPISSFEVLNKERVNKGEALFANPRNASAGSIRQLDSKITASRNLSFMGYALLGVETNTHEEEHEMIKDLGLPTNKYNKYEPTVNRVIELWHEWEKLRKKLPYQIDGMVVIINDEKLFKKLGVVGKAPRGAVAFKWPAEEVTTKIKDIRVRVGRTGVLTPTAEFEPVVVAGSTVSRATLHNMDEIEKKDVRIGDTVVIRKAGDVIPEVVRAIKDLRNGKEKKFQMPKVCPDCGGPVIRKEGEAAYRCANTKCFAIRFRGLEHFVSKNAFDIDGLGPKILEKLMNEGLIKDASDIFNLKVGDLEPLERFAEKSAQNIVDSVEKSREISLARFIYALGIRNVGEETAIDLANRYRSIENLMKASLEDINSIYDIGPVVAKSIFDYFENQDNPKFIDRLIQNGVKIEAPVKLQAKKEITGKTFVFTGGLESMTRDEAKSLIRKYGGEPSESVSKNTDYVVSGEETGSKLEKAKRLGVKIINEKKFLELIK